MESEKHSTTTTIVGFHGMTGCYSEGAAIDLFSTQPHFSSLTLTTQGFNTFPELFGAVDKGFSYLFDSFYFKIKKIFFSLGTVEYAILPLENSHSGTLHNVYDLLTKVSHFFFFYFFK